MQRSGVMGASSRAVVNANFILNTVHGIGSHNRREEVEDCWRKRRLEQDNKQRASLANATGERRLKLPYQKAAVEEAAASVEDTRTFWAEQKQRAMTATRTASPMEGALLSTMHTGTSVGRSENKTKLGKVGCRERVSDNAGNVGAKLLAAEKKRRKMKDDKKDKKDKKKSKSSKKEKRKREGQDARNVDDSNVEGLRKQDQDSDVGGAKGKKRKKRKEQKKHGSDKRRAN